jgi:hypothetical protein
MTQGQVFELSVAASGTGTIPQFGTGDWQKLDLDKTALDHADVGCQDLEMRTWWNHP